jgi:hypothetical protein
MITKLEANDVKDDLKLAPAWVARIMKEALPE